jgi:ssDNA-binding Zn-finger/Zn-ribbon topoisomerase 1
MGFTIHSSHRISLFSLLPETAATKQQQQSNMLGDSRLDLWEALCTCGGARKSPDARICRCMAPTEAGLDCRGCGQGVLLMKRASASGNIFWGCSMYQKAGCHFTTQFGPPHDQQAAQQLERLHSDEKRQLEEAVLIVDIHELEWLSACTCGAAKSLNTFECYMRSEGGCGNLPICPACGEALFLKQGINGKCWKCQRKPVCQYAKTYEPPRSQQEHQAKRYKSAATATPTTEAATTPRHLHDTSSSHATASTGKIPHVTYVLSPEQKATIEAKRQAALAKVKRTLEAAAGPIRVSHTPERHHQSPVPSSLKTALTPEQKTMIGIKRQAALAKVKRTLETAAGPIRVSHTPKRHPQSPVPSSQKSVLTPDQKTMIEAKRQAALDKVKWSMGEGAAGPTSVGQTPERHHQSPAPSSLKTALTPERR